MAIYRYVLMISILVLVRRSYSAPTLSSTEIRTTPTTNSEITPGQKSMTPAITEAVSTSKSEENTTLENNDESGSVQPTMAMENTTEKTMAGESSTVKASTEKPMIGHNETLTVKDNRTEESLKNVTASTNATNTTEEVKDYGPSSILYPVCSSYLGVRNRKIIKDEQMFASSTLNVADLMKFINSSLETLDGDSNSSMDSNSTSRTVKSNFTITGNMTAAHDGRLGNAKGSWCASGDPLDGHHHLIVDLGQVKILEGVITQGRSDSDNWVTEYTVEYSSNNKQWFPVRKDNAEMVFKGNMDRNSMAVVSFPHRIATRYVKFTPKSFHGKLMCMRVEAIGCHPDAVNVAKNQPVQQSSSERNLTSSPNAVDGEFIPKKFNETCTRTRTESSPWLRIDLRRIYHVKEIFISQQDKHDWDMWDFEVRVGKSLDNEGNDNALCGPLYTLQPGQIGTIVCKNGTVGRYVNIRIARDDSQLSLCEVAVIGVAETIVKLGLDDIADSLQTGSVIDDVGEQATALVGGLLGKLYGPAGGALLGQGMGMLSGLKGQGMGMLQNLQGQGMGMLNNLKGQGLGMANKLKDQGLAMANKMKDQAMEAANKAKDQAMGMANKMKDQAMEAANKAKEQAMEMANKAKEQGMEMANKAKDQAMDAANKAKDQAMEAADKAKEQGMAMANDLQNQGMGMVGDMQGQMNQQQDKFKNKLKEMLKKGKDYLEVGKEEMEKFKKKGYIETGKGYMDIGLGMMMDGVAFIQAKLMESLSNIAGDMSKQITTLSEYDTSDIKGLLDDVDPVPVRNFVEEAKPKIGEFIDEMQKMAKKYLEVGVEKAKEAKTEIESEAENAKNDATGLGQNVAGKATAAGKNMANKAKDVGMGAVNKAKAAGMDAVDKAKSAGMDAVNKAKSAGMDAVNKAKATAMDAANKAKEAGMGALDKAKSMGMGALGQAKGLGMGMVGDLQSAGMGALGQVKGLGMNAFGQLKQAGMGALGSLQGLGRGMLGKLSKAGQELVNKAKNTKQVKEFQQVQMLLELKKMKEMNELEKKIELEQDGSWQQFEQFNKEMEDEIKLEELRTEGEGDGFNENDVPGIGGAN